MSHWDGFSNNNPTNIEGFGAVLPDMTGTSFAVMGESDSMAIDDSNSQQHPPLVAGMALNFGAPSPAATGGLFAPQGPVASSPSANMNFTYGALNSPNAPMPTTPMGMQIKQDMPGSPFGMAPTLMGHDTSSSMMMQSQPMQSSNSFNDAMAMSQEEQQRLEYAKQVIYKILQKKSEQDQQLEQIRNLQAQLLQQPSDLAQKERVHQYQEDLLKQMQAELARLLECTRGVVLEPDALFTIRRLCNDISVQSHELRLLEEELRATSSARTVATLIIEDQGLPQVIFNRKQTFEPYIIKLLTAVMAPIDECSMVSAYLVARPDDKSKRKVPPLDKGLSGFTTEMDRMQKKASFHTMKAEVSTRMNMVHNVFTMQIKSRELIYKLETQASNPFIVITNESQWSDAAGKLFLLNAFEGTDQTQVTWPQVANVLQTQFITATRQKQQYPSRGLKHYELKYLHEKFANNEGAITNNQASALWNWFGPVMQCIRFKRHVGTMWINGFIFGFLAKDICNSVLVNYDVGTFMIRFSESNPGLFGIAYVSDDAHERIKHYLVKAKDTGSNKSLPDFIREKPHFKQLLVMPTLQIMHKDEAFKNLYSKGKFQSDKPPKGYSDLK